MSKRFGRNQRRRARETENELKELTRLHDIAAEDISSLTSDKRALQQRLVQFEGEIARMIATLEPHVDIRLAALNPGSMKVAASLEFIRPSPTAEYIIRAEQIHLLDGPEAVSCLGITIGKEIARFLANTAGRRV